jgi:hypothetical protein
MSYCIGFQAQPSWSCINCTYNNHFAMHMCEMCETPRPLEQPSNRVEVLQVVSYLYRSVVDNHIETFILFIRQCDRTPSFVLVTMALTRTPKPVQLLCDDLSLNL